MRLPVYLRDQHVTYQTLVHPPAYSAQRLAKYLRVPGRQVAKCVLLAGPSGFILAVLPATHRVDLGLAAAVLGYPLRLATAEEIALFFRDCERGSLVPFGALYGLATIVDEALNPQQALFFPAQRHFLAMRIPYGDFARLEHPRRFRFANPVPNR